MFPYIGGKKQHSKWIDPLFPNTFDTYVEVFGGAMWMYWMSKKTPVTKNVYNDFNRHLYNVFTCASTDPVQLEWALKNYKPGDSTLFEQFKNEIFSLYNSNFAVPNYDLAAKYMYLQTQFFTGGQGLHEKTKIYSNPKYKSKYLTYTEKFSQEYYLSRLHKLSTENMDCRVVIQKYDSPSTFFYIDPPYFNLEDYYTKNSFGREDHIELLNLLTNIKGKFALSYYYFKELEDIMPRSKFYWHEQVTFTNNGLKPVEGAKRNNGQPAKGIRPQRTEILILNYQPQPTINITNLKRSKPKINFSNNSLFVFE